MKIKKYSIYLWLSLFILTSNACSQSTIQPTTFNFGFEKITPNVLLPDDWFDSGSDYMLTIDTVVRNTGKVSMRIEPLVTRNSDDFGCVVFRMPAIYKAKEIEVRAAMKYTNVTEGVIGLMLRVDGLSSVLSFDNMEDRKIQGTSDWKVFSVKVPYPDKANMIYIGAILSGNGQLWVDDFQVFLDGKEIHKAKTIQPEVYKADKDIEFDKGSEISSIELTETTISDLVILGKLWGYLKYYHPGVASGNFNWDYELFRTLPLMLQANDLKERNEVLENWVSRLGKVKKSDGKKEDLEEIKLAPDLKWIEDPSFGDKLGAELAAIRNAIRKDEHYYVGLAPSVGNPIFTNEKPYTSMKYPDAGFRLLALYRYWNIIEYYFPYKHLIEEDWDHVLKELIPKFVNASNEHDYKMAVLAMTARVHDTHANLWGQDSIIRSFKGIHHAPVVVKFVENKAVVTEYKDNVLGEATGLRAGDIIEAVNEIPVAEIIKMRLPYTPASNYPTQLRDIASNLLRTNDSIIALDCRRMDSTFTLRVKCVDYKSMNLTKSYILKDTCYKKITPEIAWLYPGKIKNTYLPTIMEEIMQTKGLIIDFRCYPSDFIVFTLSEYLQPEPVKFAKFTTGSISSPGLFSMGKELEVGKRSEDYYKGKVVIIVNEETQSSAEYHTMAFRTAPGALVIGSTTAGADGNVSQFYLPGGISTMISGIGVYYPDGTETQRIGIVPDIEVRPTIAGIMEGRDEVLEKAIEIISKQ